MTEIYNKKTGKYETITRPEDMPAASWAEVVSCGGDKKRLDALWKKGNARKQRILQELKEKGKMTVEEYCKVQSRIFDEEND